MQHLIIFVVCTTYELDYHERKTSNLTRGDCTGNGFFAAGAHVSAKRLSVGIILTLATFIVGACGIQPYVLFADQSAVAPAGPKVAALMANLKCELWEAAHSDELLPYYRDDPSLMQKPNLPKRPNPNRNFTLHNLFEEIEYVAAAEYTLDVTGTGGANPSANFITPYSTPMTNFTLAVTGQLNDTAHRNINIFTSVDFSRLVKSEPTIESYDPTPIAQEPTILPCNDTNYGVENELGGQIGLKETLATGIIADSMNDVALFNAESTSPAGKFPTGVQDQSGYAFGLITAQIDFTIVAGIGGGPNWTLVHFKGPMAGGNGGSGGGGGGGSSGNSSTGSSGGSGGGSSGGGGGNGSGGSQSLLNVSRQIKDTLIIAFVPVCIRSGYKAFKGRVPLASIKDPNKVPKPPYEYAPRMVVGTPGWANYLPPCNLANKVGAYQAGVNTLKLQQLQNTLQ
jgi:uncharacterized membrane protein YgcG